MGKYGLLFLLFAAFQALGQVRNTAKTKDFPHPLYFDVVGHGVEMPPLEFHYDLASSDGRELVLGNLKLSSRSFFINVLPVKRLNSYFPKVLPSENSQDWVFLFQWPDQIMSKGLFELISRTGHVLWSIPIHEKSLSQWQAQLDSWKSTLLQSRVSKNEIAKMSLFKMQYGLRSAQSETPFWSLEEPFRFCFSHAEESGQTRMCSPFYEVIRQKDGIRIGLFPLTETPPRVIIQNQDGKLSDTFKVELEKPFQFYAELRSGYSYEFTAVPRKVNIVDMVQDPQGANALVTVENDLPPLGEAVLLNKKESSEWEDWFGWRQTIGDFRKYWKTKVSKQESFMMVPGRGGGAFRQRFVIHQLPKEESRPYLSHDTIRGTYVDGAPLRGRKLAKVQVSSKQNSVETDQETKEDFIWDFGATKSAEMNRSYLTVTDGENSFPAYHELYKGYAGEISSRMSGIVGAEGETSKVRLMIMGELALNYWFESLLGWDNSLISKQRWGMSLKAFRSLTDLEFSNRKAPLLAYTGELKYRLNPGLWSRDETWGVLGGYQHVTYEQFNAQMAGIGAFWARSMPQIFNEMIDWIHFLQYPKWVDMEFIYYPASLTSQTVLGRQGLGNWALNFHGQVLFTPRFFGEAGFGIKQYDFGFSQKIYSRSPNLTFTSSYGTIGLGFKF